MFSLQSQPQQPPQQQLHQQQQLHGPTGQFVPPPPPPHAATTAAVIDPQQVSTTSTISTDKKALNDDSIYQWISELVNGTNRERALLELGKKREQYDDLALVLWNSFGVMTVLLEEIITVYPYLNPPVLTASISNRVCNALALLQCVASNVQTRNLFLSANLPLYLYPFLSTNSRQRSFEYLRLTSLGVIGALVKNDTPEVINFLLTTEIVPLCLNIMEISSELSKTVAIFILQKILLDDQGLNYICTTYERFHTVVNVLSKMIEQLAGQISNPPNNSSGRLLKHVVRCYMRLSDNMEARKALATILPEPLRDGTFSGILQDDAATKRCLAQLLCNIEQQ
jgi:CCR4-NOT transcription complex subunit 9